MKIGTIILIAILVLAVMGGVIYYVYNQNTFIQLIWISAFITISTVAVRTISIVTIAVIRYTI